MDRNTITGIILIFAIFIGFSVFNNSQKNKEYEKAVAVAESYYAKGEFENARAEYINALRFKPNQPDAIAKINEINLKLGINTQTEKTDSLKAEQPKQEALLLLRFQVPLQMLVSMEYLHRLQQVKMIL